VAETSIEWATEVWNPFTGCDRVSPGCAHCYAATSAARIQKQERGRVAKARAEGKPDPKTRYQNDGDPLSSGPGFGFTVHWDKLTDPPRFKPGARVFVNSMSDVFHEEAPVEAIAKMWQVFADRPDVQFLVLTKRAERMQFLLSAWDEIDKVESLPPIGPLPNVWLGVTIENRKFVHRADLLRATPAAVRFISAEPLLGYLEGISLADIDWIIVGGESGPDHRPFKLDWARELKQTADAAGTAYFFKQLGGSHPGNELSELPGDLQVREFPQRELVG
jgi:protein gp37